MFPGMGKINPKQMQAMMKQMGIDQEEVDAVRVIIDHGDRKTVIENPSVQKITMQGQVSWQISGESHEESASGVRDEDVRLVMEKTGKSKEEVINVLSEINDIAEAIMQLS